MNRTERHRRISELLESLSINNNRLSLHDEEISALDLEVLKKQCVALYEELMMLAQADPEPMQQAIQEVEKKVEEIQTNNKQELEVPVQEEDIPKQVEKETPSNDAPEVPTMEEPQSIHMKLQDEAEMVSLFEKFNSKPIGDISKAISISKRFEFQNNFFDGDAKEYKNFISKIDGAGDRESAFQIYHEYKNRLEWENEDLKDELKSLLYRKYAT